MAEYRSFVIGVCCLCLATLSRSAPVAETSAGDQLKQLKAPKTNAEDDLAILLKSHPPRNVEVRQKDAMTSTTVNGETKQQETFEKKVLNKDDGELVSDIKQIVTKTESASEAPKTIVQTEVEIPAENIHQLVTQNGDSQPQIEDLPTNVDDGTYGDTVESDMDPVKVAEYLYQTGNFREFADALRDVVDRKMMTTSEAKYYYDLVVDAYRQLEEAAVEKRDSMRRDAARLSPFAGYSRDKAYPIYDDILDEESPRDLLMQEVINEYINNIISGQGRLYPYQDVSQYSDQDVDTILNDLYLSSISNGSKFAKGKKLRAKMAPQSSRGLPVAAPSSIPDVTQKTVVKSAAESADRAKQNS